MKKLLFLLMFNVFFAYAGEYEVKEVVGKVEKESSIDIWEKVEIGSIITSLTNVDIGLNSTLILRDDENIITLSSMQKGVVENLIKSSKGIRIGGKISNSNTNITARGTGNISTASTRASEATKDIEWEE
jgi:hypothetical protein